jgi:ABC-type Mn2+/Zn2+ transport system permease subunit
MRCGAPAPGRQARVQARRTRATIYIAVAIGLTSLAAGIWISAAFATENALPAEGTFLCHFGAPLLVVVGVVLVLLAIMEFMTKTTMLRGIINDQNA